MYRNDFTFIRLFKAYGRILDFRGRSTRTELLGYWIATWVVSVAIGYFGALGTMATGANVLLLSAIVNLVLLIPAPALTVRRAHDIGLPGGAALILLIPAAISMIMGPALEPYSTLRAILAVVYFGGFIMLLWQPQEGQNGYGPDPRLADEGYRQEP